MREKVYGADLTQNPLLISKVPICGEWLAADSGKSAAVFNPATGIEIAAVPLCGGGETLRAIDYCEQSLALWRRVPAAERGRLLRNWFDLMLAHEEDLAELICAEAGKPFGEARGEVRYAASFVNWFAGEAERLYGDIVPAAADDERWLTFAQPVGVCFAVTPWNFPAAMITRKAAAALAAGCTMLIKPALETPLTALALAMLAEKAGIPKGVISVITGEARTIAGVAMASEKVRKITFTGSTAVGKILMRQAADTVKRISLELGGNAPFIVFEDADLEAAVKGLIASKFRNAGQTCVCTNRVLVHEAVAEKFLGLVSEAVASLHVGNGFDPQTNIGPVINAAAVGDMARIVADAAAKGAKILQPGSALPSAGHFFKPTIISGATQEMRAVAVESFGPILPVSTFRTDEEAIAWANAGSSGLAAYFYTRSHRRIWQMSEAIEAGMVGVNRGLISNAAAPFGGLKESGIGREGSKYGIEEYLERKYVAIGL